jgi:hypothetical protein
VWLSHADRFSGDVPPQPCGKCSKLVVRGVDNPDRFALLRNAFLSIATDDPRFGTAFEPIGEYLRGQTDVKGPSRRPHTQYNGATWIEASFYGPHISNHGVDIDWLIPSVSCFRVHSAEDLG